MAARGSSAGKRASSSRAAPSPAALPAAERTLRHATPRTSSVDIDKADYIDRLDGAAMRAYTSPDRRLASGDLRAAAISRSLSHEGAARLYVSPRDQLKT